MEKKNEKGKQAKLKGIVKIEPQLMENVDLKI